MINKIVFDDVSLFFGEKSIFDRMSIELKAGKIISVVGANGSGKSTFLKLAGQFIKPTSGRIGARVKGQGSSTLSADPLAFRERVAAVAPSMTLYSELTAIENINFFVGLRNINLKVSDIDTLFNRVGLNLNDTHKFVGEFSTGMIQRLKFAILLAVKADVWLLDEPGSNLDERGKNIIIDEVKCAASEGKLILWATNDKDEAEVGDEIINLPIR